MTELWKKLAGWNGSFDMSIASRKGHHSLRERKRKTNRAAIRRERQIHFETFSEVDERQYDEYGRTDETQWVDHWTSYTIRCAQRNLGNFKWQAPDTRWRIVRRDMKFIVQFFKSDSEGWMADELYGRRMSVGRNVMRNALVAFGSSR